MTSAPNENQLTACSGATQPPAARLVMQCAINMYAPATYDERAVPTICRGSV